MTLKSCGKDLYWTTANQHRLINYVLLFDTDSKMNKFGKEALDVHNKYRVLHQVPELKWSRKLEKDAETWANQLAKEGRLKHDDTDDGENVYAVMGKDDVTGAEVVDRWYSEVEK